MQIYLYLHIVYQTFIQYSCFINKYNFKLKSRINPTSWINTTP